MDEHKVDLNPPPPPPTPTPTPPQTDEGTPTACLMRLPKNYFGKPRLQRRTMFYCDVHACFHPVPKEMRRR